MRFCLFLIIALSGVLGGCTTRPAQRGDSPAVLIEIKAPAGLLEKSRYAYPDAREGTQVRFQLPEWPWVIFDLFAYRVGVDDDPAAALQVLQKGFVGELEYARSKGAISAGPFTSEDPFKVATHAVTRTGWRGRFDMEVGGEQHGSLVYLFYRPPFALKVRASFPNYADARTDAAVDAAVRELIPKLVVTAPADCAGQTIRVGVPDDYERLPEAERKRVFIGSMGGALLRLGLDGCKDLEVALAAADAACKSVGALCGRPPWSSKSEPAGSTIPEVPAEAH